MRLPLRILGVGVHRPGLRVASTDIDARLGLPPGTSERTSGVRERWFADVGAGESASAMGESAARRALASAGVAGGDLSAVIGACGVMEQPIPGTSVLIHRRLGLPASVAAFDLNATCLSVLPALRVAGLHLAAGLWKAALIVASDLASAALDPDDPATAPLFGDGAAALVVGRGAPDEASAMIGWRMETWSEAADAAWLGAGGSRLPAHDMDALLAEARFRMDGPAAYAVAAKRMRPFVEALLEEAETTLDAIDLVVPHQASGHALRLMKRRLRLEDERVVDILADHGNQVAASLPTALAHAVESGRAHRGDRLLLLGAGAGVSLGGAVLIY